jgi:hypothetical protein
MALLGTMVTVETVYEVACKICGVNRLDGETYEYEHEAVEARDFHIQEHRERQDEGHE